MKDLGAWLLLKGSGVGGGWGAFSFVAGLNRLTLDHASPSRRITDPTPNRDTIKIWALVTFLPYISYQVSSFAYLVSFMLGHLWPPYIS